MNISNYLIDTDDLEAKLLEAQAHNERVQTLAAQVSAFSEAAQVAAMDAEFGAIGPSEETGREQTINAINAKTRTPKAVMGRLRELALDHLDKEGKTLRMLAAEGCDVPRNVWLSLKRDGRVVVVDGLWRLP